MEYVSPFDDRVAEHTPFAKRPDEVSGRTVALLDITKNRGAEFLDRIEQLLAERGAQTFRISKERFSRPAGQDVIEEIARRADLAVEALAD
jgi:hypothetical protein